MYHPYLPFFDLQQYRVRLDPFTPYHVPGWEGIAATAFKRWSLEQRVSCRDGAQAPIDNKKQGNNKYRLQCYAFSRYIEVSVEGIVSQARNQAWDNTYVFYQVSCAAPWSVTLDLGIFLLSC